MVSINEIAYSNTKQIQYELSSRLRINVIPDQAYNIYRIDGKIYAFMHAFINEIHTDRLHTHCARNIIDQTHRVFIGATRYIFTPRIYTGIVKRTQLITADMWPTRTRQHLED